MAKRKKITTKVYEIGVLDDFDGSLGDLKQIVDKLVELHTPQARISVDAGHNNVSFFVTTVKEEPK